MDTAYSDLFGRMYEFIDGVPVEDLHLSEDQKVWALILASYDMYALQDDDMFIQADKVFIEVFSDMFDYANEDVTQEEIFLAYALAEQLTCPPSSDVEVLHVIALRMIKILSYFPPDDRVMVITGQHNRPFSDEGMESFLTWVGETTELVNSAFTDVINTSTDDEQNYCVVAVVDIVMQLMESFDRLKSNNRENQYKSQPRAAAIIRHEPARKTREYAIQLYIDGGEKWSTIRQASRAISSDVVSYGLGLDVIFVFLGSPSDRIYAWLLKWNKNK
jgi:hypothetical protein